MTVETLVRPAQAPIKSAPLAWQWTVRMVAGAIFALALVGAFWPYAPLTLLDALALAPLLGIVLALAIPLPGVDLLTRVTFGFCAPATFCAVRLDAETLGYSHTLGAWVWLPVGALLIAPLIWRVSRWSVVRNNKRGWFGVVFIALVCAPFPFALICLANQQLDHARPAEFRVEIRNMRVSGFRLRHHVLDVGPWPLSSPARPLEAVSVSPLLYDQVKAGDTVCLSLHPGFLRAQWFDLDTCK
jgi:hypothetical protein